MEVMLQGFEHESIPSIKKISAWLPTPRQKSVRLPNRTFLVLHYRPNDWYRHSSIQMPPSIYGMKMTANQSTTKMI